MSESTAPKKKSGTPAPPRPDIDLRAFQYDTMPYWIFQWIDGGKDAFIRIDDEHVCEAGDWE